MESIGTVISTDKNMATVNVKRVSACGENCANCKDSCIATAVETVVENAVFAEVGDVVKIESNTADVFRAAFFLYMLPVLVAIVTAVITYGMKMNDISVILISVVSFFGSFVVIKRFENRLTPRAYITKILSKGVK